MPRSWRANPLWLVAPLVVVLACTRGNSAAGDRSARYEDLVALFRDWRAFQQPKLVNGVPDYSSSAMAAQYAQLPAWQQRLASIDSRAWTASQQVDYQLVAAEMNGLDFDQRVLRPWARNPAFYVTVFPSQSDQPLREGPHVAAPLELWTYQFPLAPDRAADVAAKLRIVPGLLEQARGNLVENAKDLWVYGIRSIGKQSADLAALSTRLAGSNPALEADIQRAREATDRFRTWLEQQAPSKTGPSGIGVANYDWYLKNVQLVPYTWAEEVALMYRELDRAHASLKLEELRNRRLPPLAMPATAEAYTQRFNSAVTEYMSFLREREILSMRDYMEPALRARVGRFIPPDRPREFFNEVSYRDPGTMLNHDYHWLDLARMAAEPHASPIRRPIPLYNIFVTRTEGFATAMEELMMQAGQFDGRPRSRELIYILVAERAARALGDLRMHSNELTLDQAAKFVSTWTPRGWVREDGNTGWSEQHLYLQQPAYGTSYVIGKIQIDQLIADRASQLGAGFSMKRFMDEMIATGLIPVSLIRRELTGKPDAF